MNREDKYTPEELCELYCGTPEDILTLRDITNKYGVKLAYLRDRFNIPLRTLQGWYYGQRTPPRYVLEMMYTILEYNA